MSIPPRLERHQRRTVVETARGSGFLAGGYVTELVTRLLIALLLARLLAPTGYGQYNLAISAGALLAGVAALGYDDAIVRYVAIQRSKNDHAAVVGSIQVGVIVGLAGGALIGVCGWFLSDWLANALFDSAELGPMIRVMAVVTPVLVSSNTLAAVARGLKRMEIVAVSENLVMSVARLAIVGVLSLVGFTPMLAVVAYCLSDAVAVASLLVLLNRHIPLGQWVSATADRRWKEMTTFAMPMWATGTITQLRRNLETIFVGALAGVAGAGVYTVVARINLFGHVIYRAVIAAVKPQLAELLDSPTGTDHLYKTATRWLVIANLPPFLAMVLYPEELLGIFGDGFRVGASAVVVLAFAELINAGTGICGSILEIGKHHRVKLINSVLWLALIVGGEMLLVPRYGILGAAVAALVATSSINVLRVLQVWVLEKTHPYNLALGKPLLAGALAYGAGLLLSGFAVGYWRLAQFPVVLVIYAGLLVIFGVELEERLVASKVMVRARRLAPMGGMR